ncbi:serine/threonine-protein phosphatase [Glycomyces sp. A-F 0318]|uniref:PP2C family protein-serine/threonine phosphatase n=1 Tax=Glycomyces amatae TaxID=2881355 RepID=UPI001E541A2A|nr:PP2C family protein-serine/threonine phosphatase [Glycomyces amatae]MCD0447352.1 serine/threonine-protein phosphatase [Glycomyces amatae]
MTARYEEGVLHMLAGLLEINHLLAFEHLPREVNRHAEMAGLHHVTVFLTDLRQEVLREMTGPGPDAQAGSPRHYAVEGTGAGRAFQLGMVVPHSGEGPDRHRWWIPLLDGTERLGVMEVSGADEEPSTLGGALLLASLVSLLLVSRSASSDAYPQLRRTQPMAIAAEMQWSLMPPQTYADDFVVISAVLEPAYRIGGDAFDYAIAGEVVHLAVFDSMGHDASAGVGAILAVAAYRQHRRRDRDLVETTEAMERFLIEQLGRERFVTGVLADLNTRTGELSWVNRGHPAPIIIRGSRWSTHPECPPAHPMGTDLGVAATLCRVQLEPGDRIVLYTDGVTEARNEAGEMFGIERFTDFLIRHHTDRLPVPETLRRLVRGLMRHHGEDLADDTTVLLAEWVGPGSADPRRPEDLVGLPHWRTAKP